MKHDELVLRASKWLRKTKGCSVTFCEMSTAAGEIPDVIGWRYGRSVLVECKASRADFFADREKTWRRIPGVGMGSERYYFTQPGLINPTELPDGWGLAECDNRHVRELLRSRGFSQRNRDSEIAFLTSMLRRVGIRVNCDLNEYIGKTPFKAGEDAALALNSEQSGREEAK